MNQSLILAAEDHCKDMEESGMQSHTGSDKSSFKDRIEKHARWGGGIYESIVYQNQIKAPAGAKDIVKFLIFDRDVEKKNNRKNLLADIHV